MLKPRLQVLRYIPLDLASQKAYWSGKGVFGEVLGGESLAESRIKFLEVFDGSEGLEPAVADLGENEVAVLVFFPFSEVPYFFIDEDISSGQLVEEVDLGFNALGGSFENMADGY